MSEKRPLTEREKIAIVYRKGAGLAGAIQTFLDAHLLSKESIIDFASSINWVDHFEKALAEYDRMPEELQKPIEADAADWGRVEKQ